MRILWCRCGRLVPRSIDQLSRSTPAKYVLSTIWYLNIEESDQNITSTKSFTEPLSALVVLAWKTNVPKCQFQGHICCRQDKIIAIRDLIWMILRNRMISNMTLYWKKCSNNNYKMSFSDIFSFMSIFWNKCTYYS